MAVFCGWRPSRSPSCRATASAQISLIYGAVDEAGVEQLLNVTTQLAVVAVSYARLKPFEPVIVDITLKQRAISHLTDRLLREVVRVKTARLATRWYCAEVDLAARGQEDAQARRCLRAV